MGFAWRQARWGQRRTRVPVSCQVGGPARPESACAPTSLGPPIPKNNNLLCSPIWPVQDSRTANTGVRCFGVNPLPRYLAIYTLFAKRGSQRYVLQTEYQAKVVLLVEIQLHSRLNRLIRLTLALIRLALHIQYNVLLPYGSKEEYHWILF